jgi:endonuclease YncB( thermonuclease family)
MTPGMRRRGGRRLRLAVAAALGVLALAPLAADGLTAVFGPRAEDGCRVLRVIDGDTVTLWCPGRGAERARLTGFDAPEVFAPGCAGELAAGLAATVALRAALARAGALAVRRQGRDRHGRALVALTLDGRPLAAAMIAGGHGRPYAGGRRDGWCG